MTNKITTLKKINKLDFCIARSKNIREEFESLTDEEFNRCTLGVFTSEFYHIFKG